MIQRLNANCRQCFLKLSRKVRNEEREKSDQLFVRLLLTCRSFLNSFLAFDETSEKDFVDLYIDLDDPKLVTRNGMTLVLSVQQICKLVRLVPPSRVLLRVRCYPHNRQINSIDYKKVQQVCNAVRENHNIKEIVLNENPIRVECEQILFDQLPDRIVQMTCKSQTCSKLLNRQCLMEKLILSETYSDENILYFNHVFQLKTRKIKLRTYFYSDIPEALPLKQNESIEVIKIDIFNLFDKDKEYWYRSYKPHYAAVFRTLRTINDKLILQLSTEFRVDDMNIHISDHNQLKEVYQEGLSKFRALIDSAADAKLPICKVSIRIQDRGLYYRWKDVSEQRSFFTSQSHIDVTGEWEPTEDGEEMSIDTRFLHNYKQTKFITKAFYCTWNPDDPYNVGLPD